MKATKSNMRPPEIEPPAAGISGPPGRHLRITRRRPDVGADDRHDQAPGDGLPGPEDRGTRCLRYFPVLWIFAGTRATALPTPTLLPRAQYAHRPAPDQLPGTLRRSNRRPGHHRTDRASAPDPPACGEPAPHPLRDRRAVVWR